MPLVTRDVTTTVYDNTGAVVPFAVVTAQLDRLEVAAAAGYVVPRVMTFSADAQGVVTLALWPNALGSTESKYKIIFRSAKSPYHVLGEVTVATPDVNCDLVDVADAPVYPGIRGGRDGSVWHTGIGLPVPELGRVPDFYLNTVDSKYYEKTAVATWTLRGALTGGGGGGGAATGGIVTHTISSYTDLMALANASGLTDGDRYTFPFTDTGSVDLSDLTGPGTYTTWSAPVEHLTLTADSTSTFEPLARSDEHPDHIINYTTRNDYWWSRSYENDEEVDPNVTQGTIYYRENRLGLDDCKGGTLYGNWYGTKYRSWLDSDGFYSVAQPSSFRGMVDINDYIDELIFADFTNASEFVIDRHRRVETAQNFRPNHVFRGRVYKVILPTGAEKCRVNGNATDLDGTSCNELHVNTVNNVNMLQGGAGATVYGDLSETILNGPLVNDGTINGCVLAGVVNHSGHLVNVSNSAGAQIPNGNWINAQVDPGGVILATGKYELAQMLTNPTFSGQTGWSINEGGWNGNFLFSAVYVDFLLQTTPDTIEVGATYLVKVFRLDGDSLGPTDHLLHVVCGGVDLPITDYFIIRDASGGVIGYEGQIEITTINDDPFTLVTHEISPVILAYARLHKKIVAAGGSGSSAMPLGDPGTVTIPTHFYTVTGTTPDMVTEVFLKFPNGQTKSVGSTTE